MSNRIENMFHIKKEQNKKALITFVTAGDPDLDTTYELVLAMEKAGADLVELGVPYSDPVAEGPVIQAANSRALKNDVRLDKLFGLAAKLRRKTNIPLVFLLYVNSILQYGKERFFESCKVNGLDGVIIPDLPFEESDEIYDSARVYDIKLIRLVTPASNDRIKLIASKAEGFLYCVSSLGVTGVRNNFKTDFDSFFDVINQFKTAPAAIGFGISTPEQIKELKSYCDGVIVGSAIVKKIATAQNSAEAIKNVFEFVKEFKKAVD
jgi:tryptophan synthase alpha chain